MSVHATQLATLMRMVQWEMDDAAHALPSGRYSRHQCQALAAVMELLAVALRAYPLVVPGEVQGNGQGYGTPTVY